MKPNTFLNMTIISLLVFFAIMITLMAFQLYWQAALCLGIVVFIGIFYSMRLKCQKNKTQIQPSVHRVPQNQIKIIHPGIKSNDIDIETKSESKFESKKMETKY